MIVDLALVVGAECCLTRTDNLPAGRRADHGQLITSNEFPDQIKNAGSQQDTDQQVAPRERIRQFQGRHIAEGEVARPIERMGGFVGVALGFGDAIAFDLRAMGLAIAGTLLLLVWGFQLKRRED